MKTLQHLNLPSSVGDNSSSGSSPDIPGIVLGRELAKNLGVIEGDVIYLISPRGMISPIGHVPAMKQFKVS